MTSLLPPASAASEPLLAVACPTCFGAVAVGAELFGLAADCPLCGQGFLVPMKAAAVSAAPLAASSAASPSPTDATGPVKPAARDPAADGFGRTAATGSVTESVENPAAAPSPAAAAIVASAEHAGPRAGASVLDGTRAEHATSAEDAAVAPDLVPMRFRDPVVTVGSGENVVELRRLSPEEKARRRTRRNVIMLLTGLSILMAIVLTLGRAR
jgi:hypothetical protein